MSKLRQIAQLGHPVLREISENVADFNSSAIQSLLEDMLATLKESHGVGLAAPQIYEAWRVVIIASRPTQRYPYAPLMQPTVMLNPVFAPRSEAMDKDWEGCLSIPGIRALVPRYLHIEVNYDDPQGRPQQCQLDDFVARIFQHEYDHLDGIVYLDRVENNRDIYSEKEFYRQVLGQ